ncbi:IS3 family transposase [Sphingobacterium sp.]|uniref:IS3 family transposase n=1 Tax=Sphingobacterium sp. TaxID=341027 RepID=UPI0028AD3CFE|nr:IS3 family transposase [Sphingobacterium sp.]
MRTLPWTTRSSRTYSQKSSEALPAQGYGCLCDLYAPDQHQQGLQGCQPAQVDVLLQEQEVRQRNDSETIAKLRELADRYPTEGQDLYYSRIRHEGLKWNYKRIRRVYQLLGMNRRRKTRRRLPARVKQPLSIPERPLKTWSLDFMSDVLTNKRKFRTLNVIDDFNRRAIAIEVAHSMPANKVTYLLDRIIKEQGKPSRFRTDNGPEFISREFRDWCAGKEIEIQYIQPGRPMQNGYIERFSRTFRESILDAYLFEDTQQVQILAEEWIQDYNYRRPHESLGGKTPMEYDALPAACYQ